jgi:hypothetical protein
MMNEKNIGQNYWVEEQCSSPQTKSDKTPYELWLGRPASIKHFKVFRSKCYIKNNDENLKNMMTELVKVSS